MTRLRAILRRVFAPTPDLPWFERETGVSYR